MKKRITALLLCLVMVFSLIPTTVWAAAADGVSTQASMGWQWTVTIIGGNYYRSDGTASSTNKYTTYKSLDNSKDNDIGYKFEWNASAGGSTYKGGWQLCITVNGSVVERTSAYIYTKNMSTASGSWTAPGSSHTGTSTHPFTLYLSSYPAQTGNCNHDYDWKDNGDGTHTGTCKNCNDKVTEKHNDGNDDGFCDKCGACVHPKDENGYCTVDGCTHPESCCPKKEDPKPPVDPPVGPSENDKPDMAELLTVECVTADAKHDPKSAQYAVVEEGTVEHPTDTTWTYTVTLNRATYIDKFNGDTGIEHTDKAPNDEITLTWTWKDGQWVRDFEDNPVIECECTVEVEKFPVNVVIYRNGDTSKAYKTVALPQMAKGEILDLTTLNIADYYTANYTGKYDFYGWYNDGTWNVYKKNVAAGKDAPAGLEKITINGWTNVICMVYDYEKVVYFQSAEALAAYQADHSKTDGLLFTTIARKGSALPTADAPTAAREGYTFQYWSREGQNEDVTGQTVSGWTNLYAEWKINTYIIASDLRLNGNETVKETGKTYSWTHRYGGEYGQTIDYTEMFDELTKKALAVDADNEPFSVDVKLCFPGTKDPVNDTPFNETILTYGQKGGGWNPGVKNTAFIWGYATTSYQVIFNSDCDTAVDTQVVKYGEKATEPATPEKYGYNFLGWFDKDGNLFSFDTEITHKTELTAKWAKKDYTIAASLYMNDADKDHPVLVDDGRYAWSHRYGGKFEETIDYTDMFAALKTKAMEVDAANEPMDAEIKLYFPGSDKLFNESVNYYGEQTASWNPSNNTAYIWGRATTFYKVTFNVEGNTDAFQKVEYNKQAVKPADPTRDGYKFTGWYDEDGNLFSFDTAITKSMTLTAGWEIVPHGIHAFARLNSAFGPLTKGEFGEDIKLNDTTLANLGLGGYNTKGYISIGEFTFDKMALTADMYMAYYDDAEFIAVVEALKTDIVLATGVTEATAEKIAWTFLFKADDSDYMTETGYPTDDVDGYQLSGNLFLAAAMFNAGDVGEDEVTGMPAVNYTVDDVIEINDFYLPGTEIELPALERTGYTFLGWEVKVIPNDDMDVYADTDTDAEEVTLVEPGKYTITEGGAIFTAHWQINTYNVTFDSNGGTDVDPKVLGVEYRAKVTKPADPTREGYHFMGWLKEDGTEWNFDEDTMPAADITLTAQWEINEYTVSFDSQGGTKVDSQIVKHGDTATQPKKPVRNGYVFKGWYLDGEKFDFSTPITSDITLTARWATKTSGGSDSDKTPAKSNDKTVKSVKTFDGGIALYVGLSVLSATGSALVITKKKRG